MILWSAVASAAGGGDFGLGIILGEPTGISGKLWISANSAVDGAAAWSLGNNEALHLHADYLLHNFSLIEVEKGRLPFYYGIGGRIRFADVGDDFIGVRIPVGLTYLFESAPLDIFLEVVPILDLAPDTDFDLNAAVGARYFF
jgi:hypothetical protein